MGQTPARGRHRPRRLGLKESLPEGALAHQSATQPADPSRRFLNFRSGSVTARTACTVLGVRRRMRKANTAPKSTQGITL